ncbi:MAG: rhodanese-like domain-containing protein [Acidobacteriaceae bacterium]|nr:rhodanese-like domain-containing protein [Acidobacteriaceae bacterium]
MQHIGHLYRSCKALVLPVVVAAGISAQDVWNSQTLIKPEAAAKQVRNSSADKPLILFVGFPAMYRGAHIPDAVLAGPASTPAGLAKLKGIASSLPRNGKVIVYCGCCPFVKCPNVKPAYTALRAMGFSQIEVLELDQNFHADWVMKGYPVERPS